MLQGKAVLSGLNFDLREIMPDAEDSVKASPQLRAKASGVQLIERDALGRAASKQAFGIMDVVAAMNARL